MLLKTSSSDKNSSFLMNNGKGKGKSRSFSSRIHRKTLRIASKPSGSSSTGKRVPIGKRISMGKNHRNIYAPFATSSSSLCDNSNDSGLGFDNHESQNTLHKTTTGSSSCNNNNNSQILTLTNNNNNNNANYNNSSANYQRSLNTIRYGETTTQPSYISTSTRMHHEVAIGGKKQLTGLGAGKKIKSIINKPHSVTKCISSSLSSNHLTLKNESEDTCGDDFFSTHIQKNNAGSKISKTIAKNGSLSNGSRSSEKEQSSSPLTLSSSSSSSSEPASPEIASSNDDVQLSPDNSDGVYLVASPLVTSSSTDSFQNNNLIAASRNGRIQLQIITQPEQQHRARYQTEGSRGAVKDKSGNGFPVVKLNGYNKPATLQVFIGNDVGRVSPHIFYQACKVSGKNSTPCNEVKIDGTMIIEIEIKPENDMTVVCDCVGILKERNVDVEHRLGKNNTLAASAVTRNKKKSTKCRMIFRTKINEDTDFPEILQICSNTITCTQPPGTPEICKKSLDSCNALGGKELFIIGKNFLKDTKVTFVQYDEIKPSKKIWEEIIQPDKEYLQQTHLICTVPALPNAEALTEPVHVQIYVTSSNKKSEPHNFIYLPLKKYQPITHSPTTIDLSNIVFTNGKNSQNVNSPPTAQLQSILSLNWSDGSATTTNPPLLPSLPARTRASSFSNFSRPRASSFTKKISQPSNDSKIALKTEIDFIEQPCSNVLQETTTTSSSINSSLQPTTSSVKDILYNDSTLLSAVSNGQCYVQPTSSTLIGPTEVEQVILNELVNTSNALDLQNIKSEQNAEIQTVAASAANVSTSMLPPIAPPSSVQ
ncbi:hypothetical protein PVAND_010966 [Polypedilum vanderplanki]|uniref:RHD domain-containing protein n=1 Tax=Polypedilum vanderplanki TaxID=319348 RepID=A0A9J6CH69_POLVA|nr:hypothetical protein PVAND_010966 [Polypedilum vanderplanki]